jgi:hypothetical protein
MPEIEPVELRSKFKLVMPAGAPAKSRPESTKISLVKLNENGSTSVNVTEDSPTSTLKSWSPPNPSVILNSMPLPTMADPGVHLADPPR